VTAAFLLLAAARAGAGPAPRIACDATVYDFGTADSTQTVRHAFVLRNAGDVSLRILEVDTTCGCVAGNLAGAILRPGESRPLDIRLSLDRRSGPLRKAIVVRSNDPRTPALELTIQGVVRSDFAVDPDHVFFGRLAPGAAATGRVEIVNSGPPLSVTAVECDSTNFTARAECLEEGRRWAVHVRSAGPLRRGNHLAAVTVRTDRRDRAIVVIPVSAAVGGAIRVAPSEIILPAGARDATRFLLVRGAEREVFEITGVEMPGAAMRSAVETFGPGWFRVRIDGLSAAAAGAAVTIRTTHPEAPVVEVPIRLDGRTEEAP
jgi:hypothetical protein